MIVKQRDCVEQRTQENSELRSMTSDELQTVIETEQERIHIRSHRAMYIILAIQALLIVVPTLVLIYDNRRNEIPKKIQYFFVDLLLVISYAYILTNLRRYHKELKSKYPEGCTEYEAIKSADREVLLFFVLICQVLIVELTYETIVKNIVNVTVYQDA